MSRREVYIKKTDRKFNCQRAVDPRLIHKEYRKSGGKVDRDLYAKVIRDVNLEICNLIYNGESITLPFGMGELFPVKIKIEKYIKDGKLVTNAPVNWYLTTELWKEDEVSKRKGKLIRYDQPYKVYISYRKRHFKYTNKAFYVFNVNRNVAKKLMERVLNKETDVPIWKQNL